MAITAAMVKELREVTGIAMMKCKKALEECDGDMDAAVEHLRKQGLATAGKKADRATNCGGLGIAFEGGKGAVVLLSCETDFVSGNGEFKSFVNELAAAALASGATDAASLDAAAFGDATVKDGVVGMISKLGENMQIASVEQVAGDVVTGYNHGGRVAALVAGSGEADVLRNVAMHVAAASPAPIALGRDGVDAALVEKEREIIAESDDVKAKPEQIRPKIIEGKL
ncbi:MAG: translation elongation factor Ts, partial [Planctomycetota bacterium]